MRLVKLTDGKFMPVHMEGILISNLDDNQAVKIEGQVLEINKLLRQNITLANFTEM